MSNRNTFFVKDRQLFSKSGEPTLLRSINHSFVWADSQGISLREIAKTGANSVRLKWNEIGKDSDLNFLLGESIKNKLIPIIGLNDSLQTVTLHNEYLIAELPYESLDSARIELTQYRAADIRIPVLVAPPRFTEITEELVDGFFKLLRADSAHNLFFLIRPKNTSEINKFKTLYEKYPLAFVLGFSEDSPYDEVLALSEELKLGYIIWSWDEISEHNSFNTLTKWGKSMCLENTNSIQSTSKIPSDIMNGNYPLEEIAEEVNLVKNGDFSEGIDSWSLGNWNGEVSAKPENGEVNFAIKETGKESWDLQFYNSVSLSEQVSYIFSMYAKSDKPRTINVNIKKNCDEYIPYANGRIVDLSSDWQEYRWKFTMKNESDSAAVLSFDMGGSEIDWSLKDVSLQRAKGEALNSSFRRRVQKNSGFFNAPNEPWELQFFSPEGKFIEVLDKGNGGEGMCAYPRMDKSGVLVIKEIRPIGT